MSDFRVVNVRHLISTKGEIDYIDLSDVVKSAVENSGVTNGLVHVFAPHATGILLLTENDDALLRDISAFITELVPRKKTYNHPSNAHAHLRSVLFPPDKTLPIIDGAVEFGTWQSLLFVETDVYPRKRTILIQIIGT